MESWLSGRKHLTANEAGLNRSRGFESLTLRKVNVVNARDSKRLSISHGAKRVRYETCTVPVREESHRNGRGGVEEILLQQNYP